MTTGKMMGFPNTSAAVVQQTDGGLLFNPTTNATYGVAQTGTTLNGIRKWDGYPNGNELRARNIADLGAGLVMTNVHCLLAYQQLIVMSNGSSNTAALNSFALTDLTYQGSFGENTSSLSNSGLYRILSAKQIVAFLDGQGRDVVVATPSRDGSFTGGAEINCITWGTKTNRRSVVTENHALLGSIPDGSGRNAWAIGYNLGAAAMTLYRIGPALGGNGVQATVGTFTPANIDPAWTNVTQLFGILVDQKDGNLIIGIQTTDSVTHQNYLVKLNSSTAAVMWTIALSGGLNFPQDNGDLGRSIVKNGQLNYIDASGVHTYDTIAGTLLSTISLNGNGPVTIHGTQISEDVSGSIMWYGGWAEGATIPAYLGTYCLAQGNHGGSQMVWRFWPTLGGVFTPPAPGNVATSRKRAWTFTLDGHTFYVLDLGQEGTFIWDKTTNSWAQFITTGYTAWNFCNGCMWGQRIVAGDQLTTDLWEMLPASSLFDNAATAVEHVVTGGIATRNRIFHSVESFTLAASVASLMAPGAATVTLSFSDDQGVTWQTMDTIALTGASNQEIAWTSLGAFANPGRVFRITDSGAFLRIDGADANIDNFDEQPPAGSGA